MTEPSTWDLVVVGAGPAGAAAALGALSSRPELSVLLLDRADFPRDKACGDGIAPHAVELLEEVGVTGLVDGDVPVRRLRLQRDGVAVARDMHRPAWVVPRAIFDARLVAAARRAGAVLRRHRVRDVEATPDAVTLDGSLRARVVIGADGVHSVVRRAMGPRQGRTAFALRGYAPTPPDRRGEQLIVFGTTHQPSYAWSFDRGDGLANVGYGELLHEARPGPTREVLLARLEGLLPGSTDGGTGWRGAHLPLSGWRWPHPRGRVLLAGDAAGLVNPLTGEGIYYAVATGILAGRVAAGAGAGDDPGESYRRAVRRLLGAHLRHSHLVGRLALSGSVLSAGMRAAADDQRVFDDLVELGLGPGRVTPRVLRRLVAAAAGDRSHRRAPTGMGGSREG